MSEVSGIKCDKCDRIHDVNSKTYFTVVGNIFAGNMGGIVGNNFGEDGSLINSSHYCRSCLVAILQDTCTDEESDTEADKQLRRNLFAMQKEKT